MKPEQVHINDVKISTLKRDGTPCIDKNGKSFTIVGILTNEYGSEWINCNYFTEDASTWKGTQQELVIFDEEYNGKTSKKFKLPFKGGAKKSSGGMSDDDRATLKGIRELAYATNVTVNDQKALLGELIRNLKLSGVLKEHLSDGSEEPAF